jgi:nucleotide-binding universal stress UspA family protein
MRPVIIQSWKKMQKIKKILFPTDFSNCANQALDKAIEFVKKLDAELHILHVSILPMPDPYTFMSYYPDQTDLKRKMSEDIGNGLEKLKLSLDKSGIPTIVAHETDFDASPKILEYIKLHSIDLTIMGTHGHTEFERRLIGSTAEELIRLSETPVMTVHRKFEHKVHNKTICVPIDYSEESSQALLYASLLSEKFGYNIAVLHVILSPYNLKVMFSDLRVNDETITHAKNELNKIAQKYISKNIDYEVFIEVSNSTVKISEFAEENKYSFILMTTHGYTGIKKMLMGSTTEKVIRSSHIPVFTLKPNYSLNLGDV